MRLAGPPGNRETTASVCASRHHDRTQNWFCEIFAAAATGTQRSAYFGPQESVKAISFVARL